MRGPVRGYQFDITDCSPARPLSSTLLYTHHLMVCLSGRFHDDQPIEITIITYVTARNIQGIPNNRNTPEWPGLK